MSRKQTWQDNRCSSAWKPEGKGSSGSSSARGWQNTGDSGSSSWRTRQPKQKTAAEIKEQKVRDTKRKKALPNVERGRAGYTNGVFTVGVSDDIMEAKLGTPQPEP